MANKTGRIAVLGAWLTAGALCFASAAQAQTITVGNATGDAGQQVTVSATLTSGAVGVAGTQNDISFAAPLAVAARAVNGKPDCKVNGDIDKGATSFAFRPNGCGGTSGVTCTSIRALVLATDNVAAIPSGSVLYTCNVNIAAGAAGGGYPLTISGVILSDPDGNQIAGATGVSGTVTVSGGTLPPTPTPTTAPVECVAPAIQLPVVQGQAGVQGSINATLVAGATGVAGTQNDVTFAAPLSIAAKATNAKPDCVVNGDIDKGATSFAFRPNGCTGAACTSIRALVLSTDNVAAIPNGSVLYTCKVNIAVDAANGTYPLAVVGVIFSDKDGNQIPGAHGCDGAVKIGILPVTPTPANTPTGGPPPPTNTPTATATNTAPPSPPTSTPTAAKTNTAKPTNTPTTAPTSAVQPFDDDGGCNISTTGSSNAGWLVLIPAIGLLVLRRRSR